MSVLNSIKSAAVPIHREGYPFIAIFAVATIILGWIWSPLFYIGVALTIWCIAFFRDPPRYTPIHEDWVISPADGVVSSISKRIPPPELGLGEEPMQHISVFMNVFNCHVNRMPAAGKILRKIYVPGMFINAELDKASEQNERNALIIETAHGDIAVVQIAGLVARRIVCWAQQGEDLGAGERFGLIRFGSRLDVYLPLNAIPSVAVGQTMTAGESTLARYEDAAIIPVVRVS